MQINKRIALSFLTIVVTLTAVVGVTLAAFNDSVTLTSNTLSTATPDLEITSANPCADYSTTDSGIDTLDAIPGQSGSLPFCLRNNSDGTLAMAITAVATVTSGALDQTLVSITVDCGLGPKAVALDGVTQSEVITNLSAGGTVASCVIKQTLSSSADNDDTSKSLNYTVTFTGTQS